jgi:GNAT superfamily N-acetyltransferase
MLAGFAMIRLACSADLPLLAAIEISAGQRFVGTPMAFAARHPASPLDALEAALAHSSLWVAIAADTPVGFAFGEAVDSWFHILEVSVHELAQGRGHGTALMATVAAAAATMGCEWLSLTTDREITFNGPWYRWLGFGEIAPDAAPDWLAAIPGREAASGLDRARRAMVRRL